MNTEGKAMQDVIPPAHVHRIAGRRVVAPAQLSPGAEAGLELLAAVIGLWPLTLSVLAAMTFLLCGTKL